MTVTITGKTWTETFKRQLLKNAESEIKIAQNGTTYSCHFELVYHIVRDMNAVGLSRTTSAQHEESQFVAICEDALSPLRLKFIDFAIKRKSCQPENTLIFDVCIHPMI
jgi:hypothetical protein